jgi:hypothetical protein
MKAARVIRGRLMSTRGEALLYAVAANVKPSGGSCVKASISRASMTGRGACIGPMAATRSMGGGRAPNAIT